MKLVIYCVTVLSVLVGNRAALGKQIVVTPVSDVKKLVKTCEAGDEFVLGPGIWKDAELTFDRLPGTAEAPIKIRGKGLGEVVFTGMTEFRVSGQYVVVSDLVFRDTTGGSDVVQFRSHSARHAHSSRITNCVFEQTPDAKLGMESRWLSIYGTKNRIDHCSFQGKRSRGATLVVWVSEGIESHRIDHNYFGPRPELGRNGGETIRIGTSDTSEFECQTMVEENYFDRCNGEAEAISNKSCGNVYQHNLFDRVSGTLTLRHGHRCLVTENIFLGGKQRGTGGVRIIGQDHEVTRNYFEGLRGDAERAALCMMNGVPDSPLNEYAPVKNALVSENVFVDCKVSVELGVGAGKKQSANPESCEFRSNLFAPAKWGLMRFHSQPIDFRWIDNLHQPGRDHKDQPVEFDRVDLNLKRGIDGLLRSMETKIPVRDWPSRDTTGPVDLAASDL